MLAEYHDEDHLVKFEELLEAAVDLDKIPDEYLICASYDAGLQVFVQLTRGHPMRMQCADSLHTQFSLHKCKSLTLWVSATKSCDCMSTLRMHIELHAGRSVMQVAPAV